MSRTLGHRRLVGTLVAVLALGAVAGCGDSDDESSAASSPAASTTAEGGGALAEAQRIVDAGGATAVFGPAAGALQPDDIVEASADAIEATPWKAEGGKPQSVVTISCASVSPTCERQAALELAALKKVGWTGEKMSAGNDYAPESFQRTMSQAIAKKPDVIITNGMSAEAIGSQLADAEKAGIFTIGTNVNEASGKGYQQYNAAGYTLSTSTLAAKMAVDQKGEGKVFWFDTPQFPFLAVPEGVEFGKQICSGCEWETQEITADKLVGQPANGTLITQTIQGNADVDSIAFSGDTPLVAGQQAIARSNNPDVKQYTVAYNAAAAEALKQGAMPAMVGMPVAWSAVLSADMALRHALGEDALPEADAKIGAMLMTQDQVPSGKLDEAAIDKWSVERFDFLAPYSEAWGVDLSTIL